MGSIPSIFSIAIYSLLGVTGSEFDDIEILEKDSKGRVMFSFCAYGYSIENNDNLYSIIICQKSDLKYTYYYPDCNYIVAPTKNEISEEEICELKEKNDWDKELNQSKMIKAKITRRKEMDNSASPEKRKIFNGDVNFDNEYITFISLGKDKDYRWLYYVTILDHDYNYIRSYMLILWR